MDTKTRNIIQEDIMVQLLCSQIRTLLKVLNHIETGNPINGFVDENIKCVEEELRWLRKSCLNN